jgi:hypothetical protein
MLGEVDFENNFICKLQHFAIVVSMLNKHYKICFAPITFWEMSPKISSSCQKGPKTSEIGHDWHKKNAEFYAGSKIQTYLCDKMHLKKRYYKKSRHFWFKSQSRMFFVITFFKGKFCH